MLPKNVNDDVDDLGLNENIVEHDILMLYITHSLRTTFPFDEQLTKSILWHFPIFMTGIPNVYSKLDIWKII